MGGDDPPGIVAGEQMSAERHFHCEDLACRCSGQTTTQKPREVAESSRAPEAVRGGEVDQDVLAPVGQAFATDGGPPEVDQKAAPSEPQRPEDRLPIVCGAFDGEGQCRPCV
jgi:hypothetical protein